MFYLWQYVSISNINKILPEKTLCEYYNSQFLRHMQYPYGPTVSSDNASLN